MTTRIFGNDDDARFWSDKPLTPINPNYKPKIKWYHIHRYTIPFNPVHKSNCGRFSETINCIRYKCRCGKIKERR